jgi:hypothetical protein
MWRYGGDSCAISFVILISQKFVSEKNSDNNFFTMIDQIVSFLIAPYYSKLFANIRLLYDPQAIVR